MSRGISSGHSYLKVNALLKPIRRRELDKMARKCQFVQRKSGRLQGFEFVQSLIGMSIDCEKLSLRTLCSNVSELNAKCKISPQALQQRINSPKATQFVKAVLDHVMTNTVMRIESSLVQHQIVSRHFKRILIQDSTECALNNSLAHSFKASGGKNNQPQACIKLDVIYEFKSRNFLNITLTDRRKPDQTLAPSILRVAEKGDLILRDLGYFLLRNLTEIDSKGVYFISRLHGGVEIFLKESDKFSVDLGRYLHTLSKAGQPIDITVYLSHQKIRCRLIAFLAPEEVKNERRRRMHRIAKKKGYTPQQATLRRLDFTILVTNAPAEILTVEAAVVLYKLRWQIELVFKSWKSQLGIKHLLGSNENRIQTLVYSRLIAAVLLSFMHGHLQRVMGGSVEISLVLLINWWQQADRFNQLIRSGLTKLEWQKLIDQALRYLSKGSRKRRTTLQQISELEICPETNISGHIRVL